MWEETQIVPESPVGGRCVSSAEAGALLQHFGEHIQEQQLDISTDGALDAFAGGVAGPTVPLRCAC